MRKKRVMSVVALPFEQIFDQLAASRRDKCCIKRLFDASNALQLSFNFANVFPTLSHDSFKQFCSTSQFYRLPDFVLF